MANEKDKQVLPTLEEFRKDNKKYSLSNEEIDKFLKGDKTSKVEAIAVPSPYKTNMGTVNTEASMGDVTLADKAALSAMSGIIKIHKTSEVIRAKLSNFKESTLDLLNNIKDGLGIGSSKGKEI